MHFNIFRWLSKDDIIYEHKNKYNNNKHSRQLKAVKTKAIITIIIIIIIRIIFIIILLLFIIIVVVIMIFQSWSQFSMCIKRIRAHEWSSGSL